MSTRLRDLDDDLGAAFRSADRDAPRPEAKAALMAALGVGVVAAASTAAAGAAAGAAGGSSAAAAKGVGLAVIAKWFVASAVIVGGTAATVHAVAPADPPAVVTAATKATAASTIPPSSVVPPSRATATPNEPAAAPSAADSPPRAADSPPRGATIRVADAPGATAGAPAGVATAPASASGGAEAEAAAAAPAPVVEEAPRRATVGDEIAALDRARSLLAGGNGSGALDALRDYRRAFPAGVLVQEASVLEIESLAAAGQRDRARALGDRFVADHPRSPLAPRVQRAMGK